MDSVDHQQRCGCGGLNRSGDVRFQFHRPLGEIQTFTVEVDSAGRMPVPAERGAAKPGKETGTLFPLLSFRIVSVSEPTLTMPETSPLPRDAEWTPLISKGHVLPSASAIVP